MRTDSVDPFIFVDSVSQLFSTMLRTEAVCRQISVEGGDSSVQEVTALIALNGKSRGTVALTLPRRTAAAVVGRLLGTEQAAAGAALTDGVAELLNIIAGGAKAKLAGETGEVIDLSLPTVIIGRDVQLRAPAPARWLDIPFDSELGSFHVRVLFQR